VVQDCCELWRHDEVGKQSEEAKGRHVVITVRSAAASRNRRVLHMVRARPPNVYKPRSLLSLILTTLAFWLRSSVVSVLNSLTTIMGAPPPLSGYLIFAASVPLGSACNPGT
jgi:hypothetical protein